MNPNKKLTQGIAMMILAAVLVCGAAFTADDQTGVPADVAVARNGKAGIVASLEQTENDVLDQALLADVAVEKTETQTVTIASKSEAAAGQEEKQAAKEAAEETEKET